MNPPRKRHRSTPACARCHKQKQKCDRGVPRCLRCVAAGVDCTSIDRQTSTEIPRSILQHLEQKLAELQRRNISLDHTVGSLGDRSCTATPSVTPGHRQTQDILRVAIGSQSTRSLFRAQDTVQHRSKLFYPSERPPLKIPVRGIYHDVQPRTAGRAHASQSSQFKARKIPLQVAMRLFRNYQEEILPRFPCFFEADLSRLLDDFYDPDAPTSTKPRMSGFVIPMVFAISSLTSNSHHFSNVAALSESLHADAMRHSGLLRQASISSLQCLLLLLQLALLLPYTGNAWYLTGEAMRMAISLGLHGEAEASEGTDSNHAELRRRIFWVTYQLDRTVGISGGCPIALSDDHITVRLPFGGGEVHGVTIDHHRFANPQEFQFILHTKVRIIQSQIHGIQFFDQPLPAGAESYQVWVSETEELVQGLVEQVTTGGAATPWLASAAHQCQVLLHRPCSRNLTITDSSIIAAATASINLINSHMTAIQAGGFVMTFELSNSAFQAGMVLLYTLRNHAHELETVHLAEAGHKTLEVLVKLLQSLSRRWPAVSDTAYYIKELVDTCLRNPVGHNGSAYDMNVLEELDCLVTQRRIHTIYHRNIPFPPQHKPGPQSDTASQASTGFLDDDNWWSAFINEDFVADGSCFLPEPSDPASPVARFSITPPKSASPVQVPTQKASDIDGVLKALPSCSYCRDRRIKCHQQLPACRECLRTSRECVIFDPILEQNVSMRRVSFLVGQIQNLDFTRSVPLPDEPSPNLIENAVSVCIDGTNDKVALMPATQTQHVAALYFGPWTLPGHLKSLLKLRPAFEVPHALQLSGSLVSLEVDDHVETCPRLPDILTARSLLDVFERSVNIFYPVFEEKALADLLQNSYDEGEEDDPNHLLDLVLGISLLVSEQSRPTATLSAEAYFLRATSNMATSCDHSSRYANVSLLQRTLLICIYLLLSPASGDIWRHLGFAIRHLFDLAHRPSLEEDEYGGVINMLTRTLYSLESQVSITFGRPSLLNIGDDLRNELTQEVTHSTAEKISIFSYLISLQSMQIHSTLLQNHATTNQSDHGLKQAAVDFRRSTDDWFVRWREWLASLPHDETRNALASWGQLNYDHVVFLVSLVWPTPGGQASSLSSSMAEAGLHLLQHQGLFARPLRADCQPSPPIVFPWAWTSSHAALKPRLRMLSEGLKGTCEGTAPTRSIAKFQSLLARLDANPRNMVTGIGRVVEELCRYENGA